MDTAETTRKRTAATILHKHSLGKNSKAFKEWLEKAEAQVTKGAEKGNTNTAIELPEKLGYDLCLDIARLFTLQGYKAKVGQPHPTKTTGSAGDYMLQIRWVWDNAQ